MSLSAIFNKERSIATLSLPLVDLYPPGEQQIARLHLVTLFDEMLLGVGVPYILKLHHSRLDGNFDGRIWSKRIAFASMPFRILSLLKTSSDVETLADRAGRA